MNSTYSLSSAHVGVSRACQSWLKMRDSPAAVNARAPPTPATGEEHTSHTVPPTLRFTDFSQVGALIVQSWFELVQFFTPKSYLQFNQGLYGFSSQKKFLYNEKMHDNG